MTRRLRFSLRAGLLCLGVTSIAAGAEPRAANPQDEAARAKEVLELAVEEAAAYDLYQQPGGLKLELREDPVLQWSNPVVGEIYGGVFLWTREGRPEAVASIFKWYSPHTHMTHEFQSLSTGDLTGSRDDRRVWATSQPGVELRPIPEALVPAESRVSRLRQMRGLARQFEVTLDPHLKGSHELRLLTQPVYRYGPGAEDWTDGAAFAFVLGTAPDALLLIESRPTAEGTDAWHYAFARVNWQRIRALHNGRQVWDVPQLSQLKIRSGSEPYTQFEFRDSP